MSDCIYHRSMADPHYVRADVWSDHTSNGMSYYIYCKSMAALHYVWADVFSDYPSDWMPCCIRHSCMAALHYVCADVCSGLSSYWRPYYKFHRENNALHFVSEFVHLEFPDKNKEKKNINGQKNVFESETHVRYIVTVLKKLKKITLYE